MPLAVRIAPHLPYLRRFSRAVTGSQTSGDAFVAAMLETLIDDISLFPNTSSDRVALYRLFCSLFATSSQKIPAAKPSSSHAWEQRAATNLSCLAPRTRQAFLLVAVEGFSHSQSAEILNIGEAEFLRLLEEASTTISRQVATEIMIIEDEPLIALDIEQMVESLGHKVVGIARTHKEAVQFFEKNGRA